MAAMQFNLLTYLGLRAHHYLLDIGCGSLRAGRLFIPYLNVGHYFGTEPEQWLLRQGIDKEVGQSLIEIKQPRFSSNSEFLLTEFEQDFDFILAQSIFSHASQAQIRTCLMQAKKVMKPGALFAASFFQDLRNYAGNQWTVKATYTLDRMKELVGEAGLSCDALDWPHTDFQTWLLIGHQECRSRLATLTDAHRILQLEAEVANLRRHRDYLLNHAWNRIGRRLHLLKTVLVFEVRGLMRAIRGRTRRLMGQMPTQPTSLNDQKPFHPHCAASELREERECSEPMADSAETGGRSPRDQQG